MKYLAVLLLVLAGCVDDAQPIPKPEYQGNGVYVKIIKAKGKEFLVVYTAEGGVDVCPIPEPQ